MRSYCGGLVKGRQLRSSVPLIRSSQAILSAYDRDFGPEDLTWDDYA